jgi:eukaryotic-like serine/threonine-protein kinase
MDRDDTLQADTIPTISGETLGGSGTARYAFGDVIGRGGMGEVFRARDAPIGRTVAVKRLKATSAEAVARFMREAQVQGRLEHPAIVPVHELGEDERGPFFVMKQLAGVTLELTLGEKSRQQLLRAFVDVCLCIEFAHTRGVVHRDLKPANIVLGEFGEVYVLDWGIARVIGDADTWGEAISGSETQVGAIIGTPGYMSPEQCGGEQVDARADVYALGCILY